MKKPLAGMLPADLAGELDIKPFQGRQLFRWIQQRQVFDFEAMTDLAAALRARLAADYTASQLALLQSSVSQHTGAEKALFRLHDGETVESVLIRDRKRVTLCLSSQAGCALQCAFCATGLADFGRDLDVHEIVEQALCLLAGKDMAGCTPNIVYMGMGEPFRNYDAVVRSMRVLMSGEGLGIGARKITVSTAGDVPGIARFAEEDWQVRLSVSLHAADDELRSRLMPLNRRYPLGKLREAVVDYCDRSRRQVTFEWVLLDGVNDRPEDARRLLDFARGLNAHVNLIPWNPVDDFDLRPSSPEQCRAFLALLSEGGLKATLRQEKGQDIDAACGQLRRTHQA